MHVINIGGPKEISDICVRAEGFSQGHKSFKWPPIRISHACHTYLFLRVLISMRNECKFEINIHDDYVLFRKIHDFVDFFSSIFTIIH